MGDFKDKFKAKCMFKNGEVSEYPYETFCYIKRDYGNFKDMAKWLIENKDEARKSYNVVFYEQKLGSKYILTLESTGEKPIEVYGDTEIPLISKSELQRRLEKVVPELKDITVKDIVEKIIAPKLEIQRPNVECQVEELEGNYFVVDKINVLCRYKNHVGNIFDIDRSRKELKKLEEYEKERFREILDSIKPEDLMSVVLEEI